MQKFEAGNWIPVTASLMQFSQVASYDKGNGDIPNEMKARAAVILAEIGILCAQADLPESFAMASRLNEQYATPVKSAELQHTFHQLMRLVESEMDKRLFFVIGPEDGQHFSTKELFGLQVFASFPSAREDVAEAGKCFALARYSASVHHSMSALEPALRALAVDVGAAVKDGMWKGVIDRIESKIGDLKKTLPSGKDRNERLQFLSEAAKEFFYFKDGWRNYIAHAKAQYDREQALGAMNHVGAFMRHLATRLQE